MSPQPEVKPLSTGHRSAFFYVLATLFFVSLPFLFLYASGYRLNFGGESALISTGGLYVAAERTGAEIYIDNELVRETRVFRRAFYAQSLPPGTHRVHVQKPAHHTWVKQLPVYAHLVTEAQAFNLPIVPQVRVIAPTLNDSGDIHLTATNTVMTNASTTNDYFVATTTVSDNLLTENSEFTRLLELFVEPEVVNTVSQVVDETLAAEIATTTKEFNGVSLYEADGQVWAKYTGSPENMPYYYCADDFELISASSTAAWQTNSSQVAAASEADLEALDLPVQEVGDLEACEPVIAIDQLGQAVSHFDFFPGSSDFLLLGLTDGIYMIEIDDRAWQNAQPLLLAPNLDFRVENGNVYVYDGELIYEVEIEN